MSGWQVWLMVLLVGMAGGAWAQDTVERIASVLSSQPFTLVCAGQVTEKRVTVGLPPYTAEGPEIRVSGVWYGDPSVTSVAMDSTHSVAVTPGTDYKPRII